MKMNIFTFRYYLVFLIFWIWGLGRSASPFCHGAPVCPSVSDTGLPYLSAVMSHLWRDFSLVMRIATIHEKCLHIFSISWAFLGVTQAYHGHILDISRAYLVHILGISWAYLGHIWGISWAYLSHILFISWAYLGHI